MSKRTPIPPKFSLEALEDDRIDAAIEEAHKNRACPGCGEVMDRFTCRGNTCLLCGAQVPPVLTVKELRSIILRKEAERLIHVVK